VVANIQTVRTLEAIRQRHSIPDDLPPISTDEELVAWGQQLTGNSAGSPKGSDRPARREPLRAARSSRSAANDTPTEPAAHAKPFAPAAPKRRVVAKREATPAPRSAETMTLDELFDDIAQRAAGAHRPSRLRAIR
jgi:hypothetical protein